MSKAKKRTSWLEDQKNLGDGKFFCLNQKKTRKVKCLKVKTKNVHAEKCKGCHKVTKGNVDENWGKGEKVSFKGNDLLTSDSVLNSGVARKVRKARGAISAQHKASLILSKIFKSSKLTENQKEDKVKAFLIKNQLSASDLKGAVKEMYNNLIKS